MKRLFASILALILFLPLCGAFWAPIVNAFSSHENHEHQNHVHQEVSLTNDHHYSDSVVDCCETEHPTSKIWTLQNWYSEEDIQSPENIYVVNYDFGYIDIFKVSGAYLSTDPPSNSWYSQLIGIVKKLN